MCLRCEKSVYYEEEGSFSFLGKVLVEDFGWERCEAAEKAASSLGRGISENGWTWGRKFPLLSDKALFFERLKSGGWPETVVVRDEASLEAALKRFSDGAIFVKHPRASGGKGTFRAENKTEAKRLALAILASVDAVVLQRAIIPATLPRGPSVFELRIFSVFTEKSAFTYSQIRAKTAKIGSTLMNRRVQQKEPDFGQYYDHNAASEHDLREALGPTFHSKTMPAIFETIETVHRAVKENIPSSTFFFVGFDFILEETTNSDYVPFLLEANVKLPDRYRDPRLQFPSPLVRCIATNAIRHLASLIHTDFKDDKKNNADHHHHHKHRWLRH